MFGPREGSWWYRSLSDPRWNVDGRSESISVTGGPPAEAREALAKLEQALGAPPDDLEYGCMKD